MVEFAPTTVDVGYGWYVDVESAEECLFLTLRAEGDCFGSEPPLADALWTIAAQYSDHRLVIDMHALTWLTSYIVGQLILVHKRVHMHGGWLRLCRLSDANCQVIRLLRLSDRFPNFPSRQEAASNHRPQKPR